MSKKRPHSSPASSSYAKSASITDRSSTFIGVYSPTTPSAALQALPEFADASHRIAAWRTPSAQRTLTGAVKYDTGHDEDGEQYAGAKLVKVLERENVTGAVVVARWYGGVLLGPVRFRWIETCAEQAIATWKGGQRGQEVKKVKVAQTGDGRRKEEIVQELKERDKNIVVLRALLAEKRDRLAGVTSPKVESPMKVMNYENMEMARLLALDKARDATVAFILKELDKIDQQIREEEELDAAFAEAAKKEDQKIEDEAFAEMDRILAEEEALRLAEEKEKAEREPKKAAADPG